MEKRLSRLSKQTGRSKSYYARRAIGEFLEEQKDYQKSNSWVKDKWAPIPLADLMKQLGLDQ
jgi:RHH-type rel operon transcriptional repressor/antitoxin RelB